MRRMVALLLVAALSGVACGRGSGESASHLGGGGNDDSSGSQGGERSGEQPGIVDGFGDPPPEPNCPPAQWDCENFDCSSERPDVAGRTCSCDEDRPLSARDCESGQMFFCLGGRSTPLSCSCEGPGTSAPVLCQARAEGALRVCSAWPASSGGFGGHLAVEEVRLRCAGSAQ